MIKPTSISYFMLIFDKSLKSVLKFWKICQYFTRIGIFKISVSLILLNPNKVGGFDKKNKLNFYLP